MKSLKENFQKGHIVIIGSGIIGKFNALELSELGFQITIIDPGQLKNSSNAALGLLMGNMYQKRRGRSWDLRKQSIELWPKWIEFLREFNQELNTDSVMHCGHVTLIGLTLGMPRGAEHDGQMIAWFTRDWLDCPCVEGSYLNL